MGNNPSFTVVKPFVQSCQIQSWVTSGGDCIVLSLRKWWIPLAAPNPPGRCTAWPEKPGAEGLALAFCSVSGCDLPEQTLKGTGLFGLKPGAPPLAREQRVPVCSSFFSLARCDTQIRADPQPPAGYCALPADPAGNNEMLTVLSHRKGESLVAHSKS